MFAAIYQFNVKPGMDEQFIAAWVSLTKLIYEFEGSLGSRLHKKSDNIYIAYAQWPDFATWDGSGKKLPDEANEPRTKMREACGSIETLHELEMVWDLIKAEPFGSAG